MDVIDVLMIAAEFLSVVLGVELVIAVVHHAMDRLGNPNCPLIGETVIKPNHHHHVAPQDFLKNGILKNSDILLGISATILTTAWLADSLSWQAWVAAIEVAVANAIHRFTHNSRRENGPVISLLQDLRLIQRREEHWRHHRGLQDSHYAPITNMLNPILEAIGFWRGLEYIYVRCFKLKLHDFKRR